MCCACRLRPPREGIRFGDVVAALGVTPEIEVGPALMGRVLDAMGVPIDEGRPLAVATMSRLDGAVRPALDRVPISEPIGTGIRAIDAIRPVRQSRSSLENSRVSNRLMSVARLFPA